MIPHDGCRGFAQGWLNEIYLTFILVTIGGGREAKSPFAKMGHVVMSLFVLVAIRFATVVFSACHTKTILLPRQARDKRKGEELKKRRFLPACTPPTLHRC
jgi:hypothetical protein